MDAGATIADAISRANLVPHGERGAEPHVRPFTNTVRVHTYARSGALSSGGARTWPTYSGSSTAVSHALNWSGLLIIILDEFRVTFWHRRPRSHASVTLGVTSERETSTLLCEDSRHSEISRCCIGVEQLHVPRKSRQEENTSR